ncbi:hypothetical protein HY17_04615 [Hyphomonas sp. CY54-11-8]|nr:hypothetical protein HY17_04615 [Hyphomonas sp. CY54-11-8]
MAAALIWGTAVIALLCALGGMAGILNKDG